MRAFQAEDILEQRPGKITHLELQVIKSVSSVDPELRRGEIPNGEASSVFKQKHLSSGADHVTSYSFLSGLYFPGRN